MINTRRKSVAQRIRLLALTSTGLAALPGLALATGLPGAGVLASGNVSLTGGGGSQTTFDSKTIFSGLNGTATLTNSGNSVVVWGASGAVDGVSGPVALKALALENAAHNANLPGFNISAGKTLKVAGSGALLDVDASGNPSTIAGTLTSTGVNLFVANANGIVVTGSGAITAPVLGLIGADVTSDETKFTTAGALNIGYASGGGSVTVDGMLKGTGGKEIVAGAGTVNVSGSEGAGLEVFGGIGGVLHASNFIPDFGSYATQTPVAASHAYTTTNVSLTNQSPSEVYADGSVAFAGNTALPTGGYGWTGTLSNSGTLSVGATGYIGGGSGSLAGESGYDNPWVTGVKGDVSYVPIGAVSNSGTIINGQIIYADGFTNTGTIYTGLNTGTSLPNGFTLESGTGAVNVGGSIVATSHIPTLASVYISAAGGNVTVSTPFISTGTETVVAGDGSVDVTAAQSNAGETFYSYAGDVTIAAATTTTGSEQVATLGGNVSVTGTQTSGGNVDIGTGKGNVAIAGPITAADEIYGYSDDGSVAVTGAEKSYEETLYADQGNISVSAPIAVVGSGYGFDAEAFGFAGTGAVSIAAPVVVVDPNTDGSYDNLEYLVGGNSVSINAAQTVTNPNFTGVEQPDADIFVNGPGDNVTIGSAGSIKAGDVYIGYTPSFGEDSTYYAIDNRANVILDGNITATNTGYPANYYTTSAEYGQDFLTLDGGISMYATNIQSNSTAVLTAQQLNADYTGNFNKQTAYQNKTNFWLNGVEFAGAGLDPTLNLYESGSAAQYTNVSVNGNVTVNAASSTTTFVPGAFLGGGEATGSNLGNAGSHVVVTATGNILIGGSSAVSGQGSGAGPGSLGASPAATGLFPYLGASTSGAQFWTPGYLYFANVNSTTPTALSKTGTITSVGNVSNDYLVPVAGSEGIFFGTYNLTLNGSLFTNNNSVVNFTTSTQVLDYKNVVYTVEPSGPYTNTLNVVPNSSAAVVYNFTP